MISGLLMAFAGSAENDQQGLDRSCAAVLARFQQLAPELDRMTREAVAVLVFPHVGKGLALAGDSSGEGAMLIGGKKTGNFSITSVSIGLTSTGADARVELIRFMTQAALRQFESAPSWYIKRTERSSLHVIGTSSYHREILRPDVFGFIVSETYLTSDTSLRGSMISPITP
jgi:lipid-binding SYLF domain-containing protein